MKRFSSKYLMFAALTVLPLMVGCGEDQGDDRLAEKARIEGREQAKSELQAQVEDISKKVELAKAEGRAQAQAELQVQLDAQAQLLEKARSEGKAVAQAELQSQIENIDLVVQKARAEGRAQAEAGINAQNGNLAAKSSEMEADLATRQLFYQAVSGTYEGTFGTETNERKVRITLVPSLPPYTSGRVRQLEEVTSDLNSLYFRAQVTEWDPRSGLSGMGCNVENIKPDIKRGEVTIASSNCPILYELKISDPDLLRDANEESAKAAATSGQPAKPVSQTAIAAKLAKSISEGKLSSLPQIVGQAYRSTNASVYKLSATRTSQE